MTYAPPSTQYVLATSKKRWTREEFRQLPETDERIEWEDEELIIMSAPNIRHQRIAGRIFGALLRHVTSHELGEVLYESEVDVSDVRTVIPDIVFVSDENARILGSQSIIGGPDLVVEILSESPQKRDWDTKLKAYRAADVKHYWIVSQSLAIWEFDWASADFKDPQFYDKGETFTPKLFPEFSFNLAELMSKGGQS